MREPALRRPRLILAICCLSLFIVGLDTTVVNLALPAIAHGLHTPASGLAWTIDAYTLALASLLVASGSLADRFGRRRVFQTGLVVFAVTSLACSLAPSTGALIAFRVLQGIGASMLNPAAMSLIATTFPCRPERSRAFGVWSGVYGAAMAAGPPLGGVVLATAGWRAIFWVNIPIALAALGLTARFVPESKADRPRRIDPLGQVLLTTLLATLTYGIIQGGHAGWDSPQILIVFTLAATTLAVLLVYEPRRADPLIELRFFRSMPFTGAIIIAVCGLAASGGFTFLTTLYLQDVRGYSALRAGLYTLPTAGMTLVFAPVSGRLAARGPRWPLLLSGTATTVGAVCMTSLDARTPLMLLLAAYTLFGLGFAMVNAPVTATAVSGMPPAQAGLASAIASAARQSGQALGVAVVGAALSTGIHGPLRTSLAAASHSGWWIITGCGATIAVLGIATTRKATATTWPRVRVHTSHPRRQEPDPRVLVHQRPEHAREEGR